MNTEDVYIGQFIEGEFFGKGLLRKGMKNPRGSMIKDMNSLVNKREELIDESLKESKVREIYDGDFVSNKKCGEGILIIDNCRYEGIFMDDNFLRGRKILDNKKIIYGVMKEGVFIEDEQQKSIFFSLTPEDEINNENNKELTNQNQESKKEE